MVKRKEPNKKKIVYFTDSHGWGGAEKYLLDLVTTIDRDKYSLEVIHPEGDDTKRFDREFGEKSIPVYSINTSNEYPLLSFLRSLLFFLKNKPDLIHFNLSWPLYCRYPILAATVLGKIIILTEHAVPHNYILRPYEGFCKRLSYSRIFQAITVCSNNKSNLVNHFKVPGRKITVIPNGIDVNRFQLSVPEKAEHYISQLTDNKTVVTTIARLDENKGHGLLIKAAQRLIHIANLFFLIVGEGPLEESLVQRVKKAGMEDKFLFLGFRREIPTILSQTDIFVLPSLVEGLPLTVLEAMAAGKPVIASNLSGIAEEVANGKTGILVPPGDPIALSRAIEVLVGDPQKRKQMGVEGRKRVEKHFPLSRMIADTEQLYEKVLDTS